MDKNNERYEIWMRREDNAPAILAMRATSAVEAIRTVRKWRKVDEAAVKEGWYDHPIKYWIVDTQAVGGETQCL